MKLSMWQVKESYRVSIALYKLKKIITIFIDCDLENNSNNTMYGINYLQTVLSSLKVILLFLKVRKDKHIWTNFNFIKTRVKKQKKCHGNDKYWYIITF